MRPNRRGRGTLLVVSGAVVVAAVSVFLYRHDVLARRQLEAVQVGWSAPPRCTGTGGWCSR